MMGLFNSLSGLQKKLVVAILSIILFTVSAGLTYSIFTTPIQVKKPAANLPNTPLPGTTLGGGEDPNQPKTETCPLNGSMHTAAAKTQWTQRRPLAVMIENSIDARPQSGLSSAD